MAAKPQVLTKEQLLREYPAEEWREPLRDVLNYVELLGDSIIAKDYAVPDDLNAAIVLTDYGKRVHQDLVTKHKVPVKEARVICFLQLFHLDLLVDLKATRWSDLHAAIHRQILGGELRYPFVFGRELYDHAAELFDDERPQLSVDDTQRLLDGTPVGVFQLGTLLTGPFGLLTSPAERALGPVRNVPLYHCSDLSCNTVHRTRLSTDYEAPINEHRLKANKVLEQDSRDPSAWGSYLSELLRDRDARYKDDHMGTLPALIGDALSATEKRLLLAWLLDNTAGRLRTALAALALKGRADDIVNSLSQAQMLQLLLLCDDVELRDALDRLVLDGVIVVPRSEVRQPVLQAQFRSGAFGARAQLSYHGIRFQTPESKLAPLRLRRLIDKVYLEGRDDLELDWQLRGVDADTTSLPARLEEFLRTHSPEDALRRLVLSRRTNLISAAHALHLDEDRRMADDDLVATMLWKLGFSVGDDRDLHARFWQLHVRLEQMARAASVTALVDHETVRASASNFFFQLEAVLDDALAYTTWALTTDHVAQQEPFLYRPLHHRLEAFRLLDAAESARASGPEELHYQDKNTLYALTRGFQALANHLETLSHAEHMRGVEQLPAYVGHTDLYAFPFLHDQAFLDLLPASRERIVAALKEVSQTLVSAQVSDLRNEHLHYRRDNEDEVLGGETDVRSKQQIYLRSAADLEKLAKGLTAIKAAVGLLEAEGFVRMPFRHLRDQADAWSRRTVFLADPRGTEVAFATPSRYAWVRLPHLGGRQYLMTSAVFAEPNELLRFRVAVDSEFARLWADFPRRRKPSDLLPTVQARAGDSTSLSQDTPLIN